MKASNESLVHQAKSGDKNALEALINRNSANAWRESETEAQQGLVVEEIMISCLQGLLLCLDREHRLAYILGEIFEVTAEQGSEKLGITPAAFRKRLSRAHARLRDFMLRNCALKIRPIPAIAKTKLEEIRKNF
jgi:DNA-directed RNA polymerase specialized sigma24 family protein